MPEERNTFLISVVPGKSASETTPSQAEIDLAKKKADDLKAKLDAGATWDDVAKEAGAGTPPDGSIGWLTPDSTVIDANTVKAVFALQPNSVTPVVQTTSGSFDIARITDVTPAKVDAQFAQTVSDAGLDQGVYKTLLGYEATKAALTASVLSDVLDKPTAQREVSQIVLNKSSGTGDEVRVSHILISPNGDPNAASNVAATDPAWTKAKGTRRLDLRRPQRGQDHVRRRGEEVQQRLRVGPGRRVTAVVHARLGRHGIRRRGLRGRPEAQPDPCADQVAVRLAHHPVHRPPPARGPAGADHRAAGVRAGCRFHGVDEGVLGRAGRVHRDLPRVGRSPAARHGPGGPDLRDAGGSVSTPLTTQSGYTIFKVNQEATRLPDPPQASLIRGSGFGYWYTPQLAKAKVEQLATPADVLGTSATTTTP